MENKTGIFIRCKLNWRKWGTVGPEEIFTLAQKKTNRGVEGMAQMKWYGCIFVGSRGENANTEPKNESRGLQKQIV